MTNRMFYLVAGLCVCCVLSSAEASTYNFDLTDLVANHADGTDAAIDLGVEFQHVESAALHLSGTFTPGVKTPVTVPPAIGPMIPSDGMLLITRLGDEGTAWIDKDVYAVQELQGSSGPVAFALPLQGVVPSDNSLPILVPSGNEPPDFGFLLDGKFAVNFGSVSYLAALYQEIQSPKFLLSGFQLQIEGSAVPEPFPLLLAIAGCLSVVGCVRHKRDRA